MEINSFCPECENGIFLYELPKPGLVPCKRCGKGREAVGKGELDGQGAISRCGFCDCVEFFRQKDFNTKLGLWIMGLIVLGAGFFFIKNQVMIAFGILVAGSLLDLGLYFGLGDIVLCYNCRAIYRGLPFNPKLEGFDLKIHDRYAFHKK